MEKQLHYRSGEVSSSSRVIYGGSSALVGFIGLGVVGAVSPTGNLPSAPAGVRKYEQGRRNNLRLIAHDDAPVLWRWNATNNKHDCLDHGIILCGKGECRASLSIYASSQVVAVDCIEQ